MLYARIFEHAGRTLAGLLFFQDPDHRTCIAYG